MLIFIKNKLSKLKLYATSINNTNQSNIKYFSR